MTTIAQLNHLVKQLNDIEGLPNDTYYTGIVPPHKCYHLIANPNNTTHYVGAGIYHLSQSYGGYMICRISLTPSCTGIFTPIMSYHQTKKECYNKASLYLNALQTEKLKSIEKLSKSEIIELLKTDKLNLYAVIDAVISVNGIVGVGLQTLGDDIVSYIKTHQK